MKQEAFFFNLLMLLVCTRAARTLQFWQVLESQQPLASPEGELRGFQESWAKFGLADIPLLSWRVFSLASWSGEGCPGGLGRLCFLHPSSQPPPPTGSISRGKPDAICVFKASYHTMLSFLLFLHLPRRESDESQVGHGMWSQ